MFEKSRYDHNISIGISKFVWFYYLMCFENKIHNCTLATICDIWHYTELVIGTNQSMVFYDALFVITQKSIFALWRINSILYQPHNRINGVVDWKGLQIFGIIRILRESWYLATRQVYQLNFNPRFWIITRNGFLIDNSDHFCFMTYY